MYRILTLFLISLPTFSFAQIEFVDIAVEAGVADQGSNYGVAIGDYNNDGFEDIYVSRTGDENRLYRNNGDQTFTNVAPEAGVDFSDNTRMAIWGDINNDGWPDLFLGNGDGIADKLYLNQGDGTFDDISVAAGIGDLHNPLAAVFGDVDNDGFLDIYLAHINGPNILWKNNGDLTFSDVTTEAGVRDTLLAMGAMFFDYDNDRDQDLYLTHDGRGPNILFQNDGTGKFVDVAPQVGADVAALGMGIDFGDINNDGWFDIYITNFQPNNLLLSNGDGTFTDITASSATADPGIGWGITFIDVDNDAFQDIYLCNLLEFPNVLYHNQQNLTFENAGVNTPLSSNANSYGNATFDLNNDGRMDLFTANSEANNYSNHLFLNQTDNSNHWVKVEVEGRVSNRSGIGAKVEIITADTRCMDMVSGGTGWSSQNSLTLHFGLGAVAMIDTIKVSWMSGITDVLVNVAADQTYRVVEGATLTSSREAQDLALSPDLFPNPAVDELFVDWKGAGEEIFQISDQTGRSLKTGILNPGRNRISVEEFTPGLYIFEINKTTLKFIKL